MGRHPDSVPAPTNAQGPELFEYTSLSPFLRSYYSFRKLRNTRFSYELWGRELSIQSSSMLRMVVLGQRLPNEELLLKISRALGWTPSQFEFARLLIQHQKSKSDEFRQIIRSRMTSFLPESNKTESHLSFEKLELLGSWVPFAILELVKFKNFSPDPRWIARQLGNGITQHEVSLHLERLERAKVLKKNEKSDYEAGSSPLKAGDQIPSPIIRKMHRQFIEAALQSVEGQSMNERFLSAMTFAFDQKQLPKAQKLTTLFLKRMAQLAKESEPSDVYQLAVQMFKLTEGSAK